MSTISSHPSTSNLLVALHPLVLLTVSDYLTRHHLRKLKGPVVGILWGTQKGREVEIEHAFEAAVKQAEDQGNMERNEEWGMDMQWVTERISAFRETHANGDVLGWFAITSSPDFTPTEGQLKIQQSFLTFNESPLLLLLNPSPAASIGGKLPIAIYESIFETPPKSDDADAMETDTPEGTESLLKFVGPLKYTLETGEAEMIGVDHIAKGGYGNAAAAVAEEAASPPQETTGKGKAPEKKEEEKTTHNALKDAGGHDELIANLTAKANALKMLHSRINLLRTYLSSLPPIPHTQPLSAEPSTSSDTLPISHPILRQIKSLTSTRLPLITPPPATEAFSQLATEQLQEENDVHLIALLGSLVKSVQQIRETGKKFQTIERALVNERFAPMLGTHSALRDVAQARGPFPSFGMRHVG